MEQTTSFLIIIIIIIKLFFYAENLFHQKQLNVSWDSLGKKTLRLEWKSEEWV